MGEKGSRQAICGDVNLYRKRVSTGAKQLTGILELEGHGARSPAPKRSPAQVMSTIWLVFPAGIDSLSFIETRKALRPYSYEINASFADPMNWRFLQISSVVQVPRRGIIDVIRTFSAI